MVRFGSESEFWKSNMTAGGHYEKRKLHFDVNFQHPKWLPMASLKKDTFYLKW
jgi:hypothetical protein